MKANSILETIGSTPHVRIQRMFGRDHEVWIKQERANPAGSIKDRIALSMVEDAERSGRLKPGGTIIEPTSGNTGIGLAMVAAVKGYPLVLVMPDSMSIERRRLMLAFGARFELTPREKGMPGSIARAKELIEQTPGSWMPQQFENPANVEVHMRTTAREILDDFPGGVDVLITGVGTGGHITGCARVLKEKFPEAQGVRGRAFRVAGHQRRQAFAASDPGHRRRIRARDPRYGLARRRHPGRGRRCEGHGTPGGARGRNARRHLLGRNACGDREEATRHRARRDGARFQLRHRGALSVDARFPAERVALRRRQVELPRFSDQLETEASMRLLGDEPITLVHVEPPCRRRDGFASIA